MIEKFQEFSKKGDIKYGIRMLIVAVSGSLLVCVLVTLLLIQVDARDREKAVGFFVMFLVSISFGLYFHYSIRKKGVTVGDLFENSILLKIVFFASTLLVLIGSIVRFILKI